jgi:hypothetical protein
MRIKSTTYSDVQQKPCQFYWHGLLHITIGRGRSLHIGTFEILVMAQGESAKKLAGVSTELH